MAIIAGIIFIIIGLVALVFLLSFASESIADITEDTKEAIDQAKVDFKGNCNLHITFFGEIDSILFSLPTALDFRFGANTQHPEIAQWFFSLVALIVSAICFFSWCRLFLSDPKCLSLASDKPCSVFGIAV